MLQLLMGEGGEEIENAVQPVGTGSCFLFSVKKNHCTFCLNVLCMVRGLVTPAIEGKISTFTEAETRGICTMIR